MANLSPAELESLLGPHGLAQVYQRATPRVPVDDFSQWAPFAEEFARSLTSRLRPLVKAASRVQPIGRKSQTAESVIANHDSRSVVGFWQCGHSMEPLSIILSPPLVATFVDRLLGGRSGSNFDEPSESRTLTEIDHRFAVRLVDAARQSLMEAAVVGSSGASFDLRELPVQTTSFEEAWLPDCPLLRLSFELRFVQGGGWLEILLPHDVVAPFVRVGSDELSKNPNAESEILRRDELQSRSHNTPPKTSVVAQLARLTLPVTDLESLAIGDVLVTEVTPNHPLDVRIGESAWLHADSGCLDGHKAVRIQMSAATK